MKRIRILAMIIVFSSVLNAQESINLEQCRKLALDHNQKMKIAREQVNATEDLKKAAFSQYLPNFSINGAYTYINKDYQLLENDKFLPVIPYTAIDPATGQLSQAALSTPSVAASTFVINPLTGQPATDASGNPVFQKYTYLPADQFKLSLDNVFFINSGFTQPIYVGGKIKEANRIAQYTKELAEHNLSLTHDELIYSVDEAYWRIISLEEKVKLASDYKNMLKRLVSDIENIRAEGIITDNDLMKARLKLSETDLLLLKADNGLELSKMALCQMIGIPYSSNLTLSDSLDMSSDILQKLSLIHI